MLGNNSDGQVDGRNPVKTVILWKGIRKGIRGFLALIVSLAALALSWGVAPECLTVPLDCDNEDSYCSNPSIFQPASSFGCSLLAESCMRACGCCTEIPTGWCPNKVITFQSIIADNQSSLIIFITVFAVLQLITYVRLCCSPSSATKKKVLLYVSVIVIFVFLIMAGYWLMYMLTDCQQKFRGISDVLLLVSPIFLLYAFVNILGASLAASAIAQHGAWLANMAAHRSRRDPNILVLDVGPDRTRRFLKEEETRGFELTVQVSRSGWLQCCRVWYCLYFAVLLAILLYFCSSQVFVATRYMCFVCGFALILGLLCIYRRIRLTKPYLDHQKRQVTRKWLQELQGPQQLLLFHNVPNAAHEGVARNSVISFGSGQVAGRSAFLFEPTAQLTPGVLHKATHTRILHGEGDETDHVLEFKVVVRMESPGALQAHIRAVSVARIPLESHHVAQVREWLQEFRETFEFETGPDLELQEPFL